MLNIDLPFWTLASNIHYTCSGGTRLPLTYNALRHEVYFSPNLTFLSLPNTFGQPSYFNHSVMETFFNATKNMGELELDFSFWPFGGATYIEYNSKSDYNSTIYLGTGWLSSWEWNSVLYSIRHVLGSIHGIDESQNGG